MRFLFACPFRLAKLNILKLFLFITYINWPGKTNKQIIKHKLMYLQWIQRYPGLLERLNYSAEAIRPFIFTFLKKLKFSVKIMGFHCSCTRTKHWKTKHQHIPTTYIKKTPNSRYQTCWAQPSINTTSYQDENLTILYIKSSYANYLLSQLGGK